MHSHFKITSLGLAIVASLAFSAVAYARFGPSEDVRPRPTAEIAAEALVSAPSEQRSALADGTVSAEEYTDAVGATVACAQAAGLDASVVPGRGMTPPSITFSAPTIEEGERLRAKLVECQSVHLNDVQRVFNAARRPTVSQLEVGRAFFAACMREHGVDAPAAPAEDQLIAWHLSDDSTVRTFDAICTARHFDELGYWP